MNKFFVTFILILIWSIESKGKISDMGKAIPTVILDADIDSDVDDVEALAMLHTMADRNELHFAGVIVTSDDPYAALCADAINAYFNRPDLPIGVLKGQKKLTNHSKYTRRIAEEFPRKLKSLSEAHEATSLYRKLLSESEDSSVVIITIGHLSNLQNLLNSKGDQYSSLNGKSLIAKKVKKWLCMGGQFPKGKEANFYRPDPGSTIYCVREWERPVVFAGWEVGQKITTGGTYLKNRLSADSPVYRAYQLYNNFAGRASWDQVAVFLLKDEANKYFNIITEGYCQVNADGSNEWRTDRESEQAYVQFKPGVNYEEIGRMMDDMAVRETPVVKIIFDTDMHTDCDDAGAMAVLHALADQGECDILAVMCSTKDPNSAPTIDAINRYYGRPDIPIGTIREGVYRHSNYTKGIAQEFPNNFKAPDTTDALQLYRDILEKQPDTSVVIVTAGYLTNISRLLQLPAEAGRLSGIDLVRQKVKKWVCMGGNFIGNPPKDDLKLSNVNFQFDASAAYYAINHWPGELVFAGREVCSVPSGLSIGEDLASTPADNPVRRAYELYFGGTSKNRHVADLASILYAVRGLRDYWDIQTKGYMDINPDMTFEWKFDKDKNQSFLLKKTLAGEPNDRYVESVLNSLLIQSPKR